MDKLLQRTQRVPPSEVLPLPDTPDYTCAVQVSAEGAQVGMVIFFFGTLVNQSTHGFLAYTVTH